MSTKTEEQQECRRRKEDTIEHKVARAAAFVGGLIVIGSVITWAGSTVFATKAEVKEMFNSVTQESSLTVDRVVSSEKDILVIKTKLENIEKTQTLQSGTLQEILKEVRK
jgi:hypothetical protein